MPEFALYDPKSGSNAKYTVDVKSFPQDHWAYAEVKASGLDQVTVIISEANESQDTTESISEPGLFGRGIIAKRVLKARISDRVYYWADFNRRPE